MNDTFNTKTETLEFHEIAEIFPLMEQEDIERLAQDIKLHGQREAIKLFEGKILDGRSRYKACILAGKEPIVENLSTDDPLKYVISCNVHRRHMNETQRAWVAANICDTQICVQHDAAKMMNVSLRSVSSAIAAKSKAIPELREAIQQGKISISMASRIADFDDDTQRELMALNKKDRLKVIKEKNLTEPDGTIRKCKVGADFTEDQVKMIDNAIKRLGYKNRSDLIQAIVVEHCKNSLPPKKNEWSKMKGFPKRFVKDHYNDKDTIVRKSGWSRQEEDEAREWDNRPGRFVGVRI